MATMEVLQEGTRGLSYINVGDMDLGQRLVRKLTEIRPGKSVCVLIKHEMPSGVALGDTAEEAFDRIFKEHQAPEDIEEFAVEAADPVHLPALLASVGLVASNGEGRRLIDQGGVRIAGEVVPAREYDVAWSRVDGQILQAGKRRYARVRAK